jgi:hypothetical protein
VEVLSFQDDVNAAGKVAEAATTATLRAALIGVLPIIEFGLLVALTLVVVSVPLKLVNRVVN